MSNDHDDNRYSDGTFKYLPGTRSSHHEQWSAGVNNFDDIHTATQKVWEQEMRAKGLNPFGGSSGGSSSQLDSFVLSIFAMVVTLPFRAFRLLVPTSLVRAAAYLSVTSIAYISYALLGGSWFDSWYYQKRALPISQVFLSDFHTSGGYDHWIGMSDYLSRTLLGGSPHVSHDLFEAWPLIAMILLALLLIALTLDIAVTIRRRRIVPKGAAVSGRNYLVRQWHVISRTPPFAWWLATILLIALNAKASLGDQLPTGLWKAPSVKELSSASLEASQKIHFTPLQKRTSKATAMPPGALRADGSTLWVSSAALQEARNGQEFAAVILVHPLTKGSILGFARSRPCGLRMGTPRFLSNAGAVIPIVLPSPAKFKKSDCVASMNLWWNDIPANLLLKHLDIQVISVEKAKILMKASEALDGEAQAES